MVEFCGAKITEQELEQAFCLAVQGLGHCQVLLEFATDVEDRMFAIAANEAYRALLKECVDSLS